MWENLQWSIDSYIGHKVSLHQYDKAIATCHYLMSVFVLFVKPWNICLISEVSYSLSSSKFAQGNAGLGEKDDNGLCTSY